MIFCRLIFVCLETEHARNCKELEKNEQVLYAYAVYQQLQTDVIAGELVEWRAYAPRGRFVCTHQMVALFCVKWRHGCYLESVASNRKSNSVNRRV